MRIDVKDIAHAVAIYFNTGMDDMRTPCNTRAASRPRMIAMFLAREMTKMSYPALGMFFSRDHSTIINAVRRIPKMMASDPLLAQQVAGCREIIPRLHAARKARVESAVGRLMRGVPFTEDDLGKTTRPDDRIKEAA